MQLSPTGGSALYCRQKERRQAVTDCSNYRKFGPVMDSMARLDKTDMDRLLLDREPETGLAEYYSAHTDWMDPDARVVFIGICPGFEQMKLSFDLVREYSSQPEEEVLRTAKIHARFGKSMRRNLIALANRTNLPDLLGIQDCAALFEPDCHLMDNTALLPYPVFRHGKTTQVMHPKSASRPCSRKSAKGS